jgi:ribonuclease HII
VAGVDEAGLGPLAGPVVAAAVIMPRGCGISGVDDSKKLTAKQRTTLCVEIRERAVAVGIGLAGVEEIALVNIYQAGLLAMRRALDNLAVPPEMVFLDARRLPDLPWPQEALIRADAQIHGVACASIVAKVHRDRLMEEYDQIYPGYGFARHKGYGTLAHRQAVVERGPCPIHRRGFRGAGVQPGLFA